VSRLGRRAYPHEVTGRWPLLSLAAVLASALLVAGCTGPDPELAPGATPPPRDAGDPPTALLEPSRGAEGREGSSSEPRAADRGSRGPRSRPTPEPRRSYLSAPKLGLRSVPVVRYPGSPDDAEGTRIQNRGPTASPRGPGGGVGPGKVGNFIVTGHRTSHSAPFANLPGLGAGDVVRVRSGPKVYVYEITGTRWTSFRSPRSLAEQSAAVPGRPRARPVQPMITLSTCATPEDHAAGNYWSDRFGNPEHRIDKIGVLVTQDGTRA
jgi:sortase A